MSRRRAFGLLWLTLLLCAPLPYFLVEVGREPVAGMAHLLVITLVLIAREGNGGAEALAAGMLSAQILIAVVVLGVVAAATVRALEVLSARRRHAVFAAVLVSIFALALTRPIYRTPFRASGLHATLSEVFE